MRRALSPSELGFTTRDRQRLQQALIATDDLRLFRRLQGVLLVASGSSFTAAAAITGLSIRTVYHLVGQYLLGHSVAALHEQARAGRPPVASEITGARILAQLARSPLELGYRTNVWTVEILAAQLSLRHQCPISPRTLRRRMRQIGLRYKRPRYVYSEKEPHLPQKKGRLSGS
jgi:transposase